MNEEKKEDEVVNEVPQEEVVVDKGQKLAEDLIAAAKKWDGRGLYKFLKVLFIICGSIVVLVEVFFCVWPLVDHNFPEMISVDEKCEKATCPKSCNGEKWAFELAGLYKEAGMISECLEECDDLILWFSEGKYIYKAMELKMQYKPLTPLQHEKYMSRLEEEKAPVEEEAPVVEDVPAVEETTVEEPPIMEELTPEEAAVEVNSAEEVQKVEEVQEDQEEVVQETVTDNKPTMSIEEIVQDWQEQQMENAQMIQAEFERVEQEKAEIAAEAEKAEEEKEEILSDDVRKLMEELEAESAEIDAQKTAKEIEEVVEDKPLLQKVVEQLKLYF